MSESSSKYDYVNLLQVKQSIGQFNTFGVVTEVKPPRKTKGTDIVLNFRITDDSLDSSFSMSVNAFAIEGR